jgi:hypothetical protein
LILQRQRRAVLEQIKMAGIGAKDCGHTAGHGFHRDQIAAAFAAIGKQRGIGCGCKSLPSAASNTAFNVMGFAFACHCSGSSAMCCRVNSKSIAASTLASPAQAKARFSP